MELYKIIDIQFSFSYSEFDFGEIRIGIDESYYYFFLQIYDPEQCIIEHNI
jgi:hypothetical protein